MFIALIVVIAFIGFIGWVLTLPSVPIAPPFKQIIIGLLVLVAALAILEFMGVVNFGILTSIPVGR